MASQDDHKLTIARYYDRSVAYWTDVYAGDYDSLGSYETLHRKQIVLRIVDERAESGSKSIDVGCGSGALLVDLLRRGHEVAGLDISAQMVAAAQRAIDAQRRGGGVCVVGDADALPFEAGSFDCAVAMGVLSHQSDPRPVVAELGRVIDDDGFVVVTVVNLLKMQYFLDPKVWIKLTSRLVSKLSPSRRAVRPGPTHTVGGGGMVLRNYHRGELGTILESSGLRIREIVPCTFGPLQFWGKEVLPLPMSVRLSAKLERLAAARGFSFIKLFANSWVIRLEKVARPD